ncbi:hypothetical protein GF325_02915 [Candidatus Bathyarchaeota archaeon]|nr:hypothetical protein [Candidatus Bathyarchaeota archaeon]
MDPSINHFRYEFMRLSKIQAIIQSSCPVAIQPSGLLEWHGEHNAVGLDGLKARYICERAITLLDGGALFPVNWVGTYGFIRYPGTVCFDDDLTRGVFLKLYKELMKIGFKVVFILSGHYGQHQMKALHGALKEARAWAKRKGLEVRLVGCKPPDMVPHVFGGDHAREFETSMLMRIAEAWDMPLVDLGCFEKGVETVPRYEHVDDEIIREPESWDWNTDLLDESVCSAKRGEQIIEAISKGIVLEIQENLNELGILHEPLAMKR